jgi:hypothetical protein
MREHDRNTPIKGMALCSLVSAMLLEETYLHKTSNSRLSPLQSREHVNPEMLGVAQPVMDLCCKSGL